jgi:murein DD-endopeptidase MepM/ murein hydrolase activator NlpD
MRALLHRCRPFVAGLILCAALAATCAPAGNAAELERAARQPLIEVVAFGVAPVAGLEEDRELEPKPGDILHRRERVPAPPEVPAGIETRVVAGESWPDLLGRLKAPLAEAVRAQVELLPALAAGKYVRLRPAEGARAAEAEYVVSDTRAYTITLRADGLQVTPHASDPRTVARIRADASKASLFTATDAIGLPEAIVLQLAGIFAGDVDFHRELHHGYRCSLVYEVLYRDGHIERAGRILAAELVIRNRRLNAYFFDGGKGRAGYFTATGRSMKKIFRRSPVEFSRITSEYTLARFHPILETWRAHRGTDYAAPAGTAVLATADGVVDFAGERGELGKLIVLRHYDRYLTYYGHLSAFAEGIAVGSALEQGQLIGFVGMTGLATGPHLHYEFHRIDGNGEWISVPPPEALEAPPADSRGFFAAVKNYRDQLELAARAHVVILD